MYFEMLLYSLIWLPLRSDMLVRMLLNTEEVLKACSMSTGL